MRRRVELVVIATLVVAACDPVRGPDGGRPTASAPMPDRGVVLLEVVPGGEAERAGLAVGDIVTGYGGVEIGEPADLGLAKEGIADGSEVEVSFARAGEARNVTLGDGPLGIATGDAADPTVLYNAACALALARDSERAFVFLETAAARGFREVETLSGDSDLESLRSDPRWPGVVAAVQGALEAYLGTVNVELYNLFLADQGARSDPTMEGRWEEVAAVDRARRQRVREMLDAGEVRSADDRFYAAMIFQHGDGSADYALANELAVEAVELGPSRGIPARWLAAATKDRHLLSLGQPQWYGTQYTVEDGVWALLPIDEGAVTDADRRAWDVPTLEEARRMLAERNRTDQPGS